MTNVILAAQSAQGGGYSMIIMMVAIFAIMYFFMIRPQQKKQKEIRNFQNSLSEGMRIITAGVMYGTIKKVNLEDGSVDVEISKGVVINVDKNYVFANAAAQQTK